MKNIPSFSVQPPTTTDCPKQAVFAHPNRASRTQSHPVAPKNRVDRFFAAKTEDSVFVLFAHFRGHSNCTIHHSKFTIPTPPRFPMFVLAWRGMVVTLPSH
jgi:hypothetical protein